MLPVHVRVSGRDHQDRDGAGHKNGNRRKQAQVCGLRLLVGGGHLY
jgi:hypothetical protein